MARLRFATELYVVAATVATTGMASAAWIDPAVTSKLTPQLVQQIADAAENEELPVLVRINRDYPLEALRALPVGQRIARIRAIAQDSQAPLLEELENRSIGAIVDQLLDRQHHLSPRHAGGDRRDRGPCRCTLDRG